MTPEQMKDLAEECLARRAFEEAVCKDDPMDETLAKAGEALHGVWGKWDIARVIAREMRRATTAEATLAEALRLLRLHHDHHLNCGKIGLPDGDGGWIEIDTGLEYSESGLYDMTEAALQGVPAPEIPVERGGHQNNWWQVGILERRKRKAAEATLARYRAALERLVNEVRATAWAEPDMRQLLGNTNYTVLMQRAYEAAALLPSPETDHG